MFHGVIFAKNPAALRIETFALHIVFAQLWTGDKYKNAAGQIFTNCDKIAGGQIISNCNNAFDCS